jgi:hypothetical protein
MGVLWMALVLFALAHRNRQSFVAMLPPLLLSVGVWLVLTGWWFAYGWMQWNDPLGVAIHASYTWQSPTHMVVPGPGEWLSDLWEWDHYTWGINMMWPEWIYSTFRLLYLGGVLLTSIFGIRVLICKGRRSTSLQQASALGLAVTFALLGGLYWQSVYDWRLGRLLYPGLTSAAVLAAAGRGWGFSQLRASRPPRFAYYGLITILAVLMQGASSAGVINAIDAYVPTDVSVRSLPGLQRTSLTFVDPTDGTTPVASVTGYDIPPQDVRAGGVMTATICWKSRGYTRESYPYALQLVGPGDVQPGTRNSYHGLGNYPLAVWKPDEAFCDATSLLVGADTIDKPRAYELVLTLFDIEPPGLTVRSVLTAYDDGHRAVRPMIARVRVAPAEQPVVTPAISLGEVAELAGTSVELLPTNTLSVSLRWVALSSPSVNAKVFLHVVDKATDAVIAQSDHEPDGGGSRRTTGRRVM